MKKILFILSIMLAVSLVWALTASAESTIDSYPSSNRNDDYLLNSQQSMLGQAFTADGKKVTSAAFYVQKVGSPTGNMTATIYASTGTFGTDMKPTGSPLATSDAVTAESQSTSYHIITFTFSGANQVTLTAGTKYVAVINYSGGDTINKFWGGFDSSSPTHDGNVSVYATSWNTSATRDLIFYVNGEAVASAAPDANDFISFN